MPPDTWLAILLLALATEFLDGFLARRFKATTTLGRFLDPIADKAFVITVIATLVVTKIASLPVFFLVLSRDLVVILGVATLAIMQRWDILSRLRPGYAGKAATALQFVFLCSLVQLRRVEPWVLYPTVAVSAVAGLSYIVSGCKALLRSDHSRP